MVDLMIDTLQKDFFAYSVGQAMFCQICEKCLDAPTSTIGTFYGEDIVHVVGCTGCVHGLWDRIRDRVHRDNPDAWVEFEDGPILFHPQLPL